MSTITTCPRCNAATEDEAGRMCIPGDDDCPMCFCDDWNDALAELNNWAAEDARAIEAFEKDQQQ